MIAPVLFGILNITADSFSDGGKYLAPDAALAQARHLIGMGADALDLGGASSNPNAEAIAPEVEIARLAPVVAHARTQGWPVSVDSFAPETQIWAMAQGVAYLNDIQGFPEPSLYPALARSDAKLIVMHSVQERGRATRVETDPASIMERLFAFFDARLAALAEAGVARDRMIVDPGMGFFLGADPEVSFTVLRGIPALKARYGLPILISLSRKGFLRKLTNRPVEEIGPATLSAELGALSLGADMIRTHEPGAIRDALTILAHIEPGFLSQIAANR